MSGSGSDYSDEQLLALLGRSLDEADPVPPDVLAMARAAPALADVDAELARLVYDSATDLVGVRGTGNGRQLNFEAAGTDLVVLITAERDLDGQLVPARAGEVELLRHTAVHASVLADEYGRFRFRDLPDGPLRLRVQAAGVLSAAFEV